MLWMRDPLKSVALGDSAFLGKRHLKFSVINHHQVHMGKLLTLHSPRDARSYYLNGSWSSETMYSLLQKHAQQRPNAFAVRDPHQRLSWADLLARVEVVAHALDQAGLVRGDRVSVWLPSSVEVVIVMLACSRNGYVCNPSLHKSLTATEVAALIKEFDCRAAFVQPGYGAGADSQDTVDCLSRIESVRALFVTPPPGQEMTPSPGAYTFPRGAVPTRTAAPNLESDKVVYLAFTSGTTGSPKGVMHSDNTLLANGRALVADWKQDERSVLLTLSPMSTHIGMVAIEQTLVAGCELIITDSQSGISHIDWIELTGATYIMGLPRHALDLLQEMELRGRPGLGRVSVFYMTGSPLSRDTATRFLQLGITPLNVYGMTENGSHQYTRPTDDAEVITDTCGTPCAGYEVSLWKRDDSNTPAPQGEVGEIGGRGAVLMLGYFADQVATERSFNIEGWFMTGDLGRFDERGNLEVIGRKNDLIDRGDVMIHPGRIEEFARRHSNVTAAAAFGLPADTSTGEQICLVVCTHGRASPVQRMREHLRLQGLTDYEMPELYAEVHELPLTASGKVLKRVLKDWIRSGRLQVVSTVGTPVHLTSSNPTSATDTASMQV